MKPYMESIHKELLKTFHFLIKVNLHLIHAMLLVKKAAAKTYENLVEDIEKEKYQAIVAACDELLLKTEEDKVFLSRRNIIEIIKIRRKIIEAE